MSYINPKKRKVDAHNPEMALATDHPGDREVASASASLSQSDISEVKAMMVHLKNEMKENMDSLSSRVDQLEQQNISKQSEINQLQSRVRSLEDRLSNMDYIEKRCDMLEQRCGHLERSMQLSVTDGDNRSTYAHKKWTIPPHDHRPLLSHWQDQGFDDNYIESMKSFLDYIRTKSNWFRMGNSCADICLGNGGDRILLHDDSLLPIWREFTDSLQLCHYSCGDMTFSASNIQLSSEVLEMLTCSTATKEFSSFKLNRNDFINVRDGVNFAIASLKNNPLMKSFYWKNNPIPLVCDVNALLKAICNHSSIKWIFLDNCFRDVVTSGYNILCTILANKPEVEVVDMESNGVKTYGDTRLTDFLSSNPVLRTLHLSNNNLNDEDAIRIAQALKQNSNLKYLSLRGNDITASGCNALRNATFDTTSFQTVVGCNHTCRIVGLPLGIGYYDSRVPANILDPNGNMHKKMRHFIWTKSKEGSIAYRLDNEFGEDPRKLTPRVLHYVGKKYNSCCSLSSMFEIVRSWQMPDLYERKSIENDNLYC